MRVTDMIVLFISGSSKKNGVRVESVLEQFDDSPESVILESVLEGMAEYYSKNLARNQEKGYLRMQEKDFTPVVVLLMGSK